MHSCSNQVMGYAVKIVAAFAAVYPQTVDASGVEHLDLAEQLIATILPATNSYGEPAQITWEGTNGLDHSTNRSKCATLVTQLFERAYNPDYVSWFGCTSPHAASYHDAIEVEDGFTLIESIHDIRPGDIIAIQYNDAGCTNLTVKLWGAGGGGGSSQPGGAGGFTSASLTASAGQSFIVIVGSGGGQFAGAGAYGGGGLRASGGRAGNAGRGGGRSALRTSGGTELITAGGGGGGCDSVAGLGGDR